MKSPKNSSNSFKIISAGAATSAWAATSTDLEGRAPPHLEDCKLAEIIDRPNMALGVLPYALDPEAAGHLWNAAEEMLGHAPPLS